MLIRRTPPFPVRSSEITPEAMFRDRRRLLAQLGASAALWLSGCGQDGAGATPARDARTAGVTPLVVTRRSDRADGEVATDFDLATTYNNYYEFGTDKGDPARHAGSLRIRPWTVQVDGLCESPGTLDIEDLLSSDQLEERIYRFRCVETWSMVVPWVGVPLGSVLQRFKPLSSARYLAFQTLYDSEQMPLSRYSGLALPYVEGLRIDEAEHPLTLLTVGMYGKTLPNQNGAPLRLVVPWKYGYKSIKSVVRMSFVEAEPPTTWNRMAANEYGFYSNVNPERAHPRWSQAQERRLSELFKRPTLMWNGYPEVASLYAGMDLLQYH